MKETTVDTSNIESDSDIKAPLGIEANHRIISGFWRRLLAFILDGLCLGLTGLIFGLFLFDPLSRLGVWGRLLGFCIAMVYFGVLNSVIGKGQTIGKRIMKIEVVDRSGNHLSLCRSLLRYAVLGIPFFLNGAMISPNVMMSPMGFLMGFFLFGAGGAIIYLYIFNQHTRQSLHDLVAGSFVTRTTPEGQVVDSMWKPHLIVVGIWFLAVVGLSVIMTGLSKKSIFQELLVVQRKIQSSGKVHMVTATVGKRWNVVDGNRSETTYFQSNTIWKERPHDNEAAAQQMASLILQNYEDIMDKDVLAVTITYGYDIGIARAWKTQRFQHSPLEWQKILDKSSVE